MGKDTFVVRQKIRELAAGMSVSKDFPEQLDAKVRDIVNLAVKRAKENGRNTVMSRDL